MVRGSVFILTNMNTEPRINLKYKESKKKNMKLTMSK